MSLKVFALRIILAFSIGLIIANNAHAVEGKYVESDNLYIINDVITTKTEDHLVPLLKAGKIDNVILASPGGDGDAAMRMGYAMREAGVTTFVPKGRYCQSACGFLFLAGAKRILDGHIGIHAFRYGLTPYGEMTAAGVRYVQPFIIDMAVFMSDMGAMNNFLADMLSVRNESMVYLDADQLLQYLKTGEQLFTTE